MIRTTGLWLALLFAAGVLVSGVGLRHGIQPNDEGLMLQAAQRIAGGQVPYRDFWWFYPPGQPYLLAGLQELTGPSLLTWRIVRVLADAGVAVLVFALAARYAPRPIALGAWAVALLAMATPSGPHPFPVTLLCCLGALLLLRDRPALAGVLCGIAAAWRLEFAAGLALGAVLGLALAPPRAQPIARFLLGAAGTALLLFLPVVVQAGAGPSWDLLVRYPLQDFSDYQRLPFPLAYDGPLNVSSLGGFVTDTLESLALFSVPLALVGGLAAGVAALVARRRDLDATQVATAIFAVVMLQYLLARADEFHTAPLAVAVAVLGAWAVTRAPRPLAIAAAAVLVVVGLVGADRRVRAITAPTSAIASPVADGVRAGRAHDRGLNATLRFVRAHTAPTEPIYVATARSDRVTAGNPLVYVLAQRPNPTAYDIQAPGVVTSAPVQREIVAGLRDVRIVVRDTSPVTTADEPNLAGRSSGVRILDDALARDFSVVRRFGPFEVLARRDAPAGVSPAGSGSAPAGG